MSWRNTERTCAYLAEEGEQRRRGGRLGRGRKLVCSKPCDVENCDVARRQYSRVVKGAFALVDGSFGSQLDKFYSRLEKHEEKVVGG